MKHFSLTTVEGYMFHCKKLPKERLVLFWLMWDDMLIFHSGWTEKMSRKTLSHRHTAIDKHMHTQDPGNHHCASQWAVRGTQRAEHSVFMCVCLSHRKQGQETHAVSPPVTTFSSSPSSLTLHSVSPVFHHAFSSVPLPMSCAPFASSPPPSDSSSSNPHPTWSAC